MGLDDCLTEHSGGRLQARLGLEGVGIGYELVTNRRNQSTCLRAY